MASSRRPSLKNQVILSPTPIGALGKGKRNNAEKAPERTAFKVFAPGYRSTTDIEPAPWDEEDEKALIRWGSDCG